MSLGARQVLALVGFLGYSAALVWFVNGPGGLARWAASFGCAGFALLMAWGWSGRDR